MLLLILAALLELAAPQMPPVTAPRPNPKPIPPKPVSPSDKVSLVAGFQATGNRLEITYTVENKRDREIYVLDVKEDLSLPYFVPQSPRARFEPPDTAVLACWWEYEPPDPTISWVHPPMFYATPVAAGQKYTNKMHARLPLAAADVPAGKSVCMRARFEIAIVYNEPEVERLESAGRSLGRLFQTARAAQRVLRSEGYPVRIPMLGKE